MKEYLFRNGIRLVYKKQSSELTSMCISLNGGATQDSILGIAHATEHMLYKGTKKRSESQINKELSEIFGFQNAMTNYPYVMYYGTSLSEDFEKGIELFSDIILNPTFNEDGFKEEMDVIKEELEEWDEDLEQYCEDKLFYNVYKFRRIKHPIIGTRESLEDITLEKIKEFYENIYFPENMTISVITSIDMEEVINILEKYFGRWMKKSGTLKEPIYEDIEGKTFIDSRDGIKSSRVQIIAPIDNLSIEEIKALRIFNEFFGEGVNSLLYDILRTKNGLIYDVLTKISNEEYIKLYKITFNTSKEKVDKALELINEAIKTIDKFFDSLDDNDVKRLIKSFRLKRLFNEEKSISLAKELASNKEYIEEVKNLESLSKEFILKTGKKVLNNYSIEIIN